MEGIMAQSTGDTPMAPHEVLSKVADAVKLLSTAFSQLSDRRREMIKPVLPKECEKLCSNTNAVTQDLLGDDLPKQVKAIREEQKLSITRKPTYNNRQKQGNSRNTQRSNNGGGYRGGYGGGGGYSSPGYSNYRGNGGGGRGNSNNSRSNNSRKSFLGQGQSSAQKDKRQQRRR
jgi:hypothetical protein